MNLHHQDNTTKVIHGDCIETMNQMEPESVDAIVTDPPYGLSFMSAKWDATPPGVQWAEACYRVLKPGGHIAAFGGNTHLAPPRRRNRRRRIRNARLTRMAVRVRIPEVPQRR